MSAASGDIDIRDAQGEFEVSCASGEIDAQQIELTSHSEFSVASGDLEVVLAKSPEFDLSLSTASGDLTLDYQGNPLVGKFEAVARKDRGQINLPVKTDKEETFTRNGKEYVRKMFRVSADKPLITLETASGEVTLKK